MRKSLSLADHWRALGVAVILLTAAWATCAGALSALNERAKAEAVTRATQLATSYEGDVSSTLYLVNNLLRFLAAYDAQNGPRRSAQLIDRERLYRGLFGNVGQAHTLVKLGRGAEALAVCDVLVRAHPNASEAHEARALALQALHRGDEADVALKRALATDAQRSQMHVRLAGEPSRGR